MKEVVIEFFEAFKKLDGEAMAACYHKDVSFEDPAFGLQFGDRAGNMWRMLCESQKGKNFQVEYSDVKETFVGITAKWEARYNFGKRKRPVHNKIKSEFLFKDGKIFQHTDSFDLHEWSKQAMGLTGKLFGNSKRFKQKLQKRTNSLLDKYMTKV